MWRNPQGVLAGDEKGVLAVQEATSGMIGEMRIELISSGGFNPLVTAPIRDSQHASPKVGGYLTESNTSLVPASIAQIKVYNVHYIDTGPDPVARLGLATKQNETLYGDTKLSAYHSMNKCRKFTYHKKNSSFREV